MRPNQYAKKLKQFNSTKKYELECAYLVVKMKLLREMKILDYGCGTGFLVEKLIKNGYIKTKGFDRYLYNTVSKDWRITETFFKFDRIYFMHSVAHIENIADLLVKIREEFLNKKGEIHVITPNKDFLDAIDNPDYKPDPTVVNHFNKQTLSELFLNSGYTIEQLISFGENEQNNERLYLKAF